jgi:phage shock protein PspC (stress-responsive transcriptional regulator)
MIRQFISGFLAGIGDRLGMLLLLVTVTAVVFFLARFFVFRSMMRGNEE